MTLSGDVLREGLSDKERLRKLDLLILALEERLDTHQETGLTSIK